MIQIMTTTSNIDIPREMKFPTTILIYKFVIFFSGASKASVSALLTQGMYQVGVVLTSDLLCNATTFVKEYIIYCFPRIGSSLPPVVCSRVHFLFTVFVFVCV